MGKFFILVITFVSITSSLFSKELNMSEFRHQQKVLTLNSFKELFKKRNLASHRRKLKLKYSRTKELHNSSIISKIIVNNTDINTATIQDNTSSSLQIKSNKELSKSDNNSEQIPDLVTINKIQEPATILDTQKSLESETILIPTPEITSIDSLQNIEMAETVDVVNIVEEQKELPTKEQVEPESLFSDEILQEQENIEQDSAFENQTLKLRSLGANPWSRK